MKKTIELHNTPALVREYVKNWLEHSRKDAKIPAAQVAVIEDVVTLIDVAIQFLEPEPTNKN